MNVNDQYSDTMTSHHNTLSNSCTVSLQYPECSYTLDVGVTSVAFSICRPNLLAVGLFLMILLANYVLLIISLFDLFVKISHGCSKETARHNFD